MATTPTVLVPSKVVENSQTTQYTASNVTAIIDKVTATNYSAGAQTLSISLVTVGDTTGNQNLTAKTVALQAGESYGFPEITGHVLKSGGYISTIASAASSINLRISGREVT